MRIEKYKEEVITYAYICDSCGKESSHRRVCSICNRDICYKCINFDPRDIGDYSEKFCADCFQIGKPYLEKMSVEEEKFGAIIKEIEQDWRDEAIKKLKETKEQTMLR